MRKKLIIIAGGLLVGFGVLLILVLSSRRNEWPEVSVTHLGYTTNSAGGRFARFDITNLGNATVVRQSWYFIEAPTRIPQNGRIVSQNRFTGGDGLLKAGASEKFLVLVPANQPVWRLSFTVSNPESDVQKVVRQTLDFANISRTAFGFHSEWIQE